jgi:hypothetical protein
VIGSLGDSGKARLDKLVPDLEVGGDFNVLTNWQRNQDSAPRGFAHAYNRLLIGAFSDPECQFAWILGDDVFPFTGALTVTQEIMEADPTIGIIFPVECWGGVPAITMLPFSGKVVSINDALNNASIEHLFAGMACCCISRAAWEAVGPIDEALGLGYGEDFDWGIRCWLAGFRVVNYRGAAFHHLRGATYNRLIEAGAIAPDMPYRSADALKVKWKELPLWDGDGSKLLAVLKEHYQRSRAGLITPGPVV